ncbi:MAG: hypothetical protein ABI890_08555 [Lapillicoccus sp.]
MAFVTDLRKTVTDATPVLAVVGVTDLAVEKVREARTQAVATRRALAAIDPKGVQKELTSQAEKAARQALDTPAQLFNRGLEIAEKAQEQYVDLSVRGEKLVRRIRTQKATQDLVHQVDQTVATGKGAVTTARKAARSTRRSALATLTTGRHELAKTVDTVIDTVEDDAKVLVPEVKASAKRTRTAAKRTATTARKSVASTTSRAKATTTTAKKSAPRARKATAAAASKVGD